MTCNCHDEIATLRQELAELRAQLTNEVRTRRLVVVDDTGFERIEAATTADAAHVRVSAKAGIGTSVEMYATEECDDADAGLYLSSAGNGAIHLDATETDGKVRAFAMFNDWAPGTHFVVDALGARPWLRSRVPA